MKLLEDGRLLGGLSGPPLLLAAMRGATAPARRRALQLFGSIFVWLLAFPAPPISAIAEPVPRSALILDQSDADGAWYPVFSSAFRSTLNAKSAARVSVFAEHLDLSRFRGAKHDQLLQAYLRDKFNGTPVGVVLAQGSSALDFVIRSRAELWPKVPVVFAAVDDATLARLQLPPDVTGATYELTLRDAVYSAKTLVPNLKRLAIVGDPFERQAVRSHYEQELPVYAAEYEIIDLLGLPMAELRTRVAVLPVDTAIIYMAINIDGAGVTYSPPEGLAAFAEVANRPIVVDTETNIGYGGTGGLMVSAGPVADEAAQRVLRVLDGEEASAIPITKGNFARPIFDWRQLQRFAISERNLPVGSEIRFRPPTAWEQYRWQIVSICAVILFQVGLISGLLFEHRRRSSAEAVSRRRLLETIHLNRAAAAGQMSASIMHEISQPLAAIGLNTVTALDLLGAKNLDPSELKEILADIQQDKDRAVDVIKRMRDLFQKRADLVSQEFDLNEAVWGAIHILEPEARKRGVALNADVSNTKLPVRANRIQMEQVILNLGSNAMDAMQDAPMDKRRFGIRTALIGTSDAMASVFDSGTGIPEDKLKSIFEPFTTTKEHGTGLGLSIAQTIIATYGGKIWAENQAERGAVFRFTLPLAKAGDA